MAQHSNRNLAPSHHRHKPDIGVFSAAPAGSMVAILVPPRLAIHFCPYIRCTHLECWPHHTPGSFTRKRTHLHPKPLFASSMVSASRVCSLSCVENENRLIYCSASEHQFFKHTKRNICAKECEQRPQHAPRRGAKYSSGVGEQWKGMHSPTRHGTNQSAYIMKISISEQVQSTNEAVSGFPSCSVFTHTLYAAALL